MTLWRRAWIREEARRALLLAGATRPDQIDPVRTAKALDIEITYGGITGAAERISMLDRHARIRITDGIVQRGRIAFATVHGVGHKVCGHVVSTDRDVDDAIGATLPKRFPRDSGAFDCPRHDSSNPRRNERENRRIAAHVEAIRASAAVATLKSALSP